MRNFGDLGAASGISTRAVIRAAPQSHSRRSYSAALLTFAIRGHTDHSEISAGHYLSRRSIGRLLLLYRAVRPFGPPRQDGARPLYVFSIAIGNNYNLMEGRAAVASVAAWQHSNCAIGWTRRADVRYRLEDGHDRAWPSKSLENTTERGPPNHLKTRRGVALHIIRKHARKTRTGYSITD